MADVERWLHHRRGLVAWWMLIGCTAVNGVVVGYGALHILQFSVGRGDHLVSGGGYAAAAVVLMAAAAGAAGWRAPRSVVLGTSLLAVPLAALALRSFLIAGWPLSSGNPWDSPWDGAGGVLWAPWTWLLLVYGLLGTCRLIRRRRHSRRRAR